MDWFHFGLCATGRLWLYRLMIALESTYFIGVHHLDHMFLIRTLARLRALQLRALLLVLL